MSKKKIILTLLLAFSLSTYSQIIRGGDATEALNSVPSDLTIGNPCGVPSFMNIHYNGDYVLSGDLHMQDGILTIYGSFNKNGFDVYYDCDDAEIIIEDETLSIQTKQIEDFSVYPNPTNGIFHVKTSKHYTVDVYDMNGKLVTKTPDLRNLPSGIYLAMITIDGIRETKKIIRR
tara:strand:- start:14283 stop:14807 length:525 start_codon:yes stop_codon:yes gene_type:complete